MVLDQKQRDKGPLKFAKKGEKSKKKKKTTTTTTTTTTKQNKQSMGLIWNLGEMECTTTMLITWKLYARRSYLKKKKKGGGSCFDRRREKRNAGLNVKRRQAYIIK